MTSNETDKKSNMKSNKTMHINSIDNQKQAHTAYAYREPIKGPHSLKNHEFKWRNKLNKEMNEKIHFLYEISKGFPYSKL